MFTVTVHEIAKRFAVQLGIQMVRNGLALTRHLVDAAFNPPGVHKIQRETVNSAAHVAASARTCY